MPRKYSAEVDEAIWAMLCNGYGPSVIQRKLAAGEAGVTAVTVPIRTLSQKIKKLKDARGIPVPTIEPGSEYDAATALQREALGMAKQQLEKLRRRDNEAGDDPLSAADLDRLQRLVRLTGETVKQIRRDREGQEPTRNTDRAGSEDTRKFLLALAQDDSGTLSRPPNPLEDSDGE